MVKDGGCNFFLLKLNDWVQFIAFMQEWSNIMNHGQKFDNQYFELTTKQTNLCHNHALHETHKNISSTHSSECESLLLQLLDSWSKIQEKWHLRHNFMCKEVMFKL
jgi:hypothetical protein